MLELVKSIVRGLPGFGTLQAIRDLARGGDRRRSGLLRLLRPAGLFQPFGDTADDRYPGVFGFVAWNISKHDGAILSFGCSTGEEVFSLRRYFPKFSIKGIDISPQRIEICRRQATALQDPNVRFAVSADATGEPSLYYDAIFAMAVFRHGALSGRPPACLPLLSFARFEEAAAGLARCLKPGGYLAIRNANFRFEDTQAASGFDAVLSTTCGSPRYGPDNRLLPDEALERCVFVKKGG